MSHAAGISRFRRRGISRGVMREDPWLRPSVVWARLGYLQFDHLEAFRDGRDPYTQSSGAGSRASPDGPAGWLLAAPRRRRTTFREGAATVISRARGFLARARRK